MRDISALLRSSQIRSSRQRTLIGITIEGHGGRASLPHKCIDAVLGCAQLITARKQKMPRYVDTVESAAISICETIAGTADSTIPHTAELRGTIGR